MARRRGEGGADADYQAAAKAAWQPADPAATKTAYDTLNDELLKGLFLVEIGVVFRQWVASERAQGIGWTKRSEITLTDAYKPTV